MADDLTLARFEGPLYGVVFRRKAAKTDSFYTRAFNTRSDLGYIDSEYQGNYDMEFHTGFLDFLDRVKRTLNSVPGDLRERDAKDSIDATVFPHGLTNLTCTLLLSADLRETLQLGEGEG